MTVRTQNQGVQPEVGGGSSHDASKASEPGVNQNDLQTTLTPIVDSKSAVVDIVVVHGLNPVDGEGHAGDTWTVGGKLWLRDFLPRKAPPMRVLLFGYNSHAAFSPLEAGVGKVAKNLLDLIKDARKDSNRPLIFICHSLGGLIVKKAVLEAQTNDSYTAIRACTYGLAFFGTPHRKSGHTGSWGDVAERVARYVLGNPESAFTEGLRLGSQFAEELSEGFRKLKYTYNDYPYPVINFCETREHRDLGLIVDRYSGALQLYTGIDGPVTLLDADHGDICKFESIEDEGYKTVKIHLLGMIRDAIIRPTMKAGRRNISSVIGETNFISQVGGQNQVRVRGESNSTQQIGRGNAGIMVGTGNMVYQESPPDLQDYIRDILIALQLPTLLSWVSRILASLSSQLPTTPANRDSTSRPQPEE
ncbi:hypothetical protein O1611_g1880 [Lasiodiplodia mahajangana]|uniref:Uncharacterized protein n=1 Tax=Lasiodiplodia mahajangana TaxID=1108764 RepID=A0ACC2JWF6_9PEZI|nr:hypothetical protein O1611_g1880 [Lasiodiplodia mahajangana]